MNSEIFNRLEGLMKSLALSVEAGSYTRAEMKAYTVGLELAEQRLDEVLRELFVNTAQSVGLSMLLSLIGKRSSASQEEAREIITKAISAKRRAFKKSEYDELISSAQPKDYGVTGNELWLDLGGSFGRQVLDAVSKLVKAYLPCSTVISFVGSNGRSFSEWGEMELRWFEIDNWDMPFSALETL